jgi:hypothetical protein
VNTRETFGSEDCPGWQACDTIGAMPEVDFSLLEVPRPAPIDDPEAFLRAAMAWHFGEDTGSAFWLRAANDLPFDPTVDSTRSRICDCFPIW